MYIFYNIKEVAVASVKFCPANIYILYTLTAKCSSWTTICRIWRILCRWKAKRWKYLSL